MLEKPVKIIQPSLTILSLLSGSCIILWAGYATGHGLQHIYKLSDTVYNISLAVLLAIGILQISTALHGRLYVKRIATVCAEMIWIFVAMSAWWMEAVAPDRPLFASLPVYIAFLVANALSFWGTKELT